MTTRSFDFPGIREVSIPRWDGGSVVIEPGPRADIVEGSLSCLDEAWLSEVSIEPQNQTLAVDLPRHRPCPSPAHLRLGVPPGLAYAISAASADVRLSADAGRARIKVGSGDVTLGRTYDVRCSVGSGDLTLSELLGAAPAHLDTGSGGIRIGTVACSLTVKSGSGDVSISRVHGGQVRASTGSGDLTVAATDGAVDLRTASGEITVGVAEDLPAWLDLHAATGLVRIALEASPEPDPGERFVSVRARTGSGEIAVYRS